MNERLTDRVTDADPSHPSCHRANAENFLVHLRLPFQLTLAPFMLWGAALARTPVTARFVIGFVVMQVCFYGGTTAYNSHYDRDEGPVGGLEHPPPVGPWLLPGSLILQAFGLAVAAWVGLEFFFACLAFFVLGILYSHPATRWKGNPWLSWFVVMFGQGAIGTAAGVVAGWSPRLTPEIACGLVAAAALVGGLYPLTQLFQTEEDAARGDRTTAIALGRKGTRAASAILSLLGATFAGLSAYFAGRPADAMLLAFAAVPMTAGAVWVCAPGDVSAVYKRVSRFQLAAGGAFGIYAVLRLCFT